MRIHLRVKLKIKRSIKALLVKNSCQLLNLRQPKDIHPNIKESAALYNRSRLYLLQQTKTKKNLENFISDFLGAVFISSFADKTMINGWICDLKNFKSQITLLFYYDIKF